MRKNRYLNTLWEEILKISPISTTGIFFTVTYLLSIAFLFVFGFYGGFYWNMFRADFLALVGMISTELFTEFRFFKNAKRGLKRGGVALKRSAKASKAQVAALGRGSISLLSAFPKAAGRKSRTYACRLQNEFQSISAIGWIGIFFISTYLLSIAFLFAFGFYGGFYWNMFRADFLALVGMASTELFTGFRFFKNAKGGLARSAVTLRKDVVAVKTHIVGLGHRAQVALPVFLGGIKRKSQLQIYKLRVGFLNISPLSAVGVFFTATYLLAIAFLFAFGFYGGFYWNMFRADFLAIVGLISTELFTGFKFFKNAKRGLKRGAIAVERHTRAVKMQVIALGHRVQTYALNLQVDFLSISPISGLGVFFTCASLFTISLLIVFGCADDFYWNMFRADVFAIAGMISTELFTEFKFAKGARRTAITSLTRVWTGAKAIKAQAVALSYRVLVGLLVFTRKTYEKIDAELQLIKHELNSLSPTAALGAFLVVSYSLAFCLLQVFGYSNSSGWNVVRADFFALAGLLGTELFTNFRFFRKIGGRGQEAMIGVRTFVMDASQPIKVLVSDVKQPVKESVTVLKANLEKSTNVVKRTYPILKTNLEKGTKVVRQTYPILKETPSLALNTVKKVADETKECANGLKEGALYFKKVETKRIKHLTNPRRFEINSILDDIKHGIQE